MAIRLIVGLGNPGKGYAHTRHNVGFSALDHYARHGGLGWTKGREGLFAEMIVRGAERLVLAKPSTFMNRSGRCVAFAKRLYGLSNEEIVVVGDDVEVPLGSVKISTSPGTAGHNGVRSVRDQIGPGFVRYRVGVGPKNPAEMPLDSFVLSPFAVDEMGVMSIVYDLFVKNIEVLVDKGIERGLNDLVVRV
jgi:PTH1 family peptidyl-tRNA hydrolase